jgi:hypothetical protein
MAEYAVSSNKDNCKFPLQFLIWGVVLGRSGSEIGLNLNQTEPNTVCRFKIQQFAEPELQLQFGVQPVRVAFKSEIVRVSMCLNAKPNLNLCSGWPN